MAALGVVLSLVAVFSPNMLGLIAVVGISLSLSLMFPTIYGVALQGLGPDTKFGAAGLVMAILGGALLPPVQGLIMDVGTRTSASWSRPSASPSWPPTRCSISGPLGTVVPRDGGRRALTGCCARPPAGGAGTPFSSIGAGGCSWWSGKPLSTW